MAETVNNELEMLTRKEVAELLKINLRTVDKRVLANDLPAYKLGASTRFKKCDVAKYIDNSLLNSGE
ncbi:MAG: helix-turn-helix domain-containing protein [Bacteroidota bacterium]